MAKYVSRPLANTMLSASGKALILEGARAVGKTSLVQQQLMSKGFHYETFGNSSTFKQATNNLDSWVASLQTPVIIDEAQRIAELPLAIKERVDRMSAASPQFVLTGSASINRKGLDGQDPLTRRAQRFTLYPLTQRELLGNSRSVVDDFWESTPNEIYRGKTTRENLVAMMATGGFPRYAIEIPETHPTMGENERGLSIRNDIDGILGDTLLPDEHLDKTIAQTILDTLLSRPGDIINVAKIADELQYNSRTINRYMSIFVNRFLVYPLRNLQLKSGKQTFTRAKIHPVDTSYSVEALRKSGESIALDPVLFGHVFESFVVNQIIASVQWSNSKPDYFFWRSKTQDEVDLVLLQNGKLIGIEIKSSESIDNRDFKGLKSLAKCDTRFEKGFLVYTGERVIEWGKDLWAIPVTGLWDKGAFLEKTRDEAVFNSSGLTHEHETDGFSFEPAVDANLFLSYCHSDDDHLDGAIIKLIKAVAEEYQFQFANKLKVFIDRESINWGEDWREAIRSGIETTNFLIAAVTPTYLTRRECRKELLDFYGQIEGDPCGSVLSLVWQDYSPLRNRNPSDNALKIIDQHQYIEVDDLQGVDEKNAEYRKRVKVIVTQLREAIERTSQVDQHNSNDMKETTDASLNSAEDMGMVEIMDTITELVPQFQNASFNLQARFEHVTKSLNEHPLPQNATPKSLLMWTRETAGQTEEDVQEINAEIDNISSQWDAICNAARRYISLLSDFPEGEERMSNLNGFEATLLSMKHSFEMPTSLDEVRSHASLLKNLSPRLRPLAASFESVFELFSNMSDAVEELIRELREARDRNI